MAKIKKTCMRGRATVRIESSRNGQFYFEMLAGNGETMAVSETYTRRADAIRGAVRFRDLVGGALIVSETPFK